MHADWLAASTVPAFFFHDFSALKSIRFTPHSNANCTMTLETLVGPFTQSIMLVHGTCPQRRQTYSLPAYMHFLLRMLTHDRNHPTSKQMRECCMT